MIMPNVFYLAWLAAYLKLFPSTTYNLEIIQNASLETLQIFSQKNLTLELKYTELNDFLDFFETSSTAHQNIIKKIFLKTNYLKLASDFTEASIDEFNHKKINLIFQNTYTLADFSSIHNAQDLKKIIPYFLTCLKNTRWLVLSIDEASFIDNNIFKYLENISAEIIFNHSSPEISNQELLKTIKISQYKIIMTFGFIPFCIILCRSFYYIRSIWENYYLFDVFLKKNSFKRFQGKKNNV